MGLIVDTSSEERERIRIQLAEWVLPRVPPILPMAPLEIVSILVAFAA